MIFAPLPKTIWKSELPIDDTVTLYLPALSKPISVGMQGGSLCVWYSVYQTDAQESIAQKFYIRGTGHPLREAASANFIGTAIDHERGLVWHVFYE